MMSNKALIDRGGVEMKKMKVVSYRSQPYKCIQWNSLSTNFRKITIQKMSALDWENITEIHIIGSKKEMSDDEIEIEEKLWGEYINNEGCLVCIYNYQIESIPWINKLSSEIEILDIRFTEIHEVDLSCFDNLRRLVLTDNCYLSKIIGFSKINSLKDISLSYTAIESFPKLDCFPSLNSLNIRNTKISSLETDGYLTCLKYLDLSDSLIAETGFLEKCPLIERLSLSGLKIETLANIQELRRIESINLSRTNVQSLPDLSNLLSLKSINLSYTKITSFDSTKLPVSLRTLVLDGTGIETIPSNVTLLSELRKLMLNELHLKTLPIEILDLHLDFNLKNKGFGICLLDTEIEDMDSSIFLQPREILESWFLHRNNNDEHANEALNEAKVVFLGDGGAGKSLSIQRLINDCKEQPDFDGETTPGISIQNKYYTIDEKQILVHYWDFGGQEIMHSMHRMFLTKRTLYVVFINARDNTQDERARYWLHNIKSFADHSPVLLVINQIDQNPSASVNETSLKLLYPELKDIVKLSATCFSSVDFKTDFQDKIANELTKLPTINEPFLYSWKLLKNRLQSMQDYYIDKNKFLSICNECKVDDSISLRTQLLGWFNDLGISFCYQDNYNLSEYMILRPDWITNAIYIILFNCGSMVLCQ